MPRLCIFLILIFCSSANLVAKEIIPYASIGIRIGWDSKFGLSTSPKLSVGLAEIKDGAFINLTFGSRKFQKPVIGYNRLSFLDIRAGAVFKELPGILFGGGAGLLFGSSNKGHKIIPRSTVFAGCFLFPTIDVTFWNSSTISFEAGIETVLPIPLGPIDIGSIGVF